jgi:hypothetical protein
VLVLSDEFYREISRHPIPTDMESVKALSDSPAVLDLFMWLSYRCFITKGEESIPLFGPFGLAAQIGSVEYARPRRFRGHEGTEIAEACSYGDKRMAATLSRVWFRRKVDQR